MKYVSEYRDAELVGATLREIGRVVRRHKSPRPWVIMEICGGQTHAIVRHGIDQLLPPEIELVHGPGCPVCVTPLELIDKALAIAARPNVIFTSYGDMLRVPGSGGDSLLKARARGADVRMVYSIDDALALARRHPDRQVIFFAIGFETTTPPTAVAIRQAAAEGLGNFSVFCNHVLTPSAIASILESPEVRDLGSVKLDGFVGPAHVSTVIGSRPYEYFAAEYAKPVVIAGFEPLDVLQAVRMLVRQVNAGQSCVENEFARAVSRDGNRKAQKLVAEVFELRKHFDWRGLGRVPYSALRIKSAWADFDAERRFAPEPRTVPDHKACECAAILRGVKRPQDCRLFGSACTPETPMGSCMVSSEGACAAHWSYGRFRSARPA